MGGINSNHRQAIQQEKTFKRLVYAHIARDISKKTRMMFRFATKIMISRSAAKKDPFVRRLIAGVIISDHLSCF